jgi:hypothetical protein
MRLKEDSYSWRASGLLRRNARQDKPPDAHRPVAGKKDTRRWCKGVAGREHKPVCMPWRKFGTARVGSITDHWRLLACSVCGKELASYTPWGRGSGMPAVKKPDWVTN